MVSGSPSTPTLSGRLIVVGLFLVLLALGWWFRRSLARASIDSGSDPRMGDWFPGALGLALAVIGAVALLRARVGAGWSIPLQALVTEPSVASLALLALASLLSPLRGTQPLAWGALQVSLLAVILFSLVTGWRGPIYASLALAPLAIHGLLTAGYPARFAAGCVATGSLFFALAVRPPGPAPLPPEEDELVGFTHLPSEGPAIAGWVSDAVPATSVRARYVSSEGTRTSAPVLLGDAADGKRAFCLAVPESLEPGHWVATLEILGASNTAEPTVLGRRSAGSLRIPGPLLSRLVRFGFPALLAALFLLVRSRRVFALTTLGLFTLAWAMSFLH